MPESLFLSVDADVDEDLRAALAQEQLDMTQLSPSVRNTVRKLWENNRCRQLLCGELGKIAAADVDLDDLVSRFENAVARKKAGHTAVEQYLERKVKLTPGAASTVAWFTRYHRQLAKGALFPPQCLAYLCAQRPCSVTVTPFMRALGEFPRHIYHGTPLSPDLAKWMPEVRALCK
jgi:hypothetical protein